MRRACSDAACRSRKAKPEARAFLRERHATNAAAPTLDRNPAEIEAQTCFPSTLLPFHEKAENLFGTQVPRKAGPFVVHVGLKKIALVIHADRHTPAGRRIAKSVFQKIRKDSLQSRILGSHRPLDFQIDQRRQAEAHSFGLKRRPECSRSLPGAFQEIAR